MLEREPCLVWLTITGERTVVGLIGVYLVIFVLPEPDEPLLLRELDLDREPPDREPPERPPPPRPLASEKSNKTNTVRKIQTSTVNLHTCIMIEQTAKTENTVAVFCQGEELLKSIRRSHGRETTTVQKLFIRSAREYIQIIFPFNTICKLN